MMNREELEKLNKNELIELVMALFETVAKLEARVAELEEQIRQNSSNSSKPPSSYCMVSVDKTAEMLRSLTGQSISAGTILPMIKECAKKCEPDVETIKIELKGST